MSIVKELQEKDMDKAESISIDCSVFDTSKEAMMCLSEQGKILYVNAAAGLLLRSYGECLIGCKIFPEQWKNIWHEVIREGKTRTLSSIYDEAGRAISVELIASRAKWGKTEAAILLLRDKTVDYFAEAHLRNLIQRQRQILKAAATAILIINDEHIIEDGNQAFFDTLQMYGAAVIGQKVSIVLGLDKNFFTELPKRDVQSRIETIDGRNIDVLLNAEHLLDGQGNSIGVVISFVDVSEFLRARKVAEAASQAKSRFLANMSHEIRTPLNGLIGMTELAISSCRTKEVRGYLNTSIRAAESLKVIINDILDFSKIEAGMLDISPVDVDLHEIIVGTVRTLAFSAQQKQLELMFDVEAGVPVRAKADPVRIRQVLTNLLTNAIKFTDEGEVSLSVGLEGFSDSQVILKFSVSDTGVGIAEDKKNTIFQPFAQAASTTSRLFGGTGLGLSIAAHLVKIMGGEMSVSSELDVGTTFDFTLCLDIPQQEQKTCNFIPHALRSKNVLVVDDNENVRHLVSNILKGNSCKPVAVATAEEAKTMLAMSKFDFAIIDGELANSDGVDSATDFRDKHNFTGPMVLMLTYSAGKVRHKRCLAIDKTRYILKPIRQAELIEALLAANGKPAQFDETVKSELSSQTLKPLSILVADDNLVNREFARGVLSKRGHSITVVCDGEEAFDHALARPFDIILLDAQMPNLNGTETLRRIKGTSNCPNKETPTAIFTASTMKGDKERFLAEGFDLYLAKPISACDLISAIEGLERPNEGENCEKEIPANNEEGTVFDEASALMHVGGQRDLLGIIISAFEQECDNRMNLIRVAIGKSDPVALHEAAHSLKGAAANVGAQSLFEVARTLCDLGRAGSTEGANERFLQLEKEVERFKPVIEKLGRN